MSELCISLRLGTLKRTNDQLGILLRGKATLQREKKKKIK